MTARRNAKLKRGGSRATRGAVLLEVVLALALFLAAAGFVMSALAMAAPATQRLRLEAEAVDLATTVLSEMRMGLRDVAGNGPEPFDEPWQDWSWEIQAAARANDFGVNDPLREVRITITHQQRGMIYHLYGLLPIAPEQPAAEWAIHD